MLTPSAHNAMVASLQLTLQHLRDHPAVPCCQNCENFAVGVCRQYGKIEPHYQQTPGCPDWQEELPF